MKRGFLPVDIVIFPVSFIPGILRNWNAIRMNSGTRKGWDKMATPYDIGWINKSICIILGYQHKSQMIKSSVLPASQHIHQVKPMHPQKFHAPEKIIFHTLASVNYVCMEDAQDMCI